MKTLVLVFIGMMWVFLAKLCQGHRTQEKQTVLKTATSTDSVHLAGHDINVDTEIGWQTRAAAYCSVRLCKNEGPMPRCASPRTRLVSCIQTYFNNQAITKTAQDHLMGLQVREWRFWKVDGGDRESVAQTLLETLPDSGVGDPECNWG